MLIEETVINDVWHGFDGVGGDNKEYRKESLLSETEKGEKANIVRGFQEKHGFKIICHINVPFRKVLLKIGCHSIMYLDLISLEVSHNQSQLAKITKDDVNFRSGWLHDEIINSYCFKFSCSLGMSYISAPLKHCLFIMAKVSERYGRGRAHLKNRLSSFHSI